MSSKPLVLRVQTSQGMRRMNLTANSTWADLKAKVSESFSIPPDQQIISRSPPQTKPDFIDSVDSQLLLKLGLKHGDIIHLVLGTNHATEVAKKARLAEEEAEEKGTSAGVGLGALPAASPKKKGPRSVTLATSEWVNDPTHKEDKGPKHVPFHEWIQERQKRYANQPWNIDPPQIEYKPVPYKRNIQFKELPPNAVIKFQEYRHVDTLFVEDKGMINHLKSHIWGVDDHVQRAAFLIGNYEMRDESGNERMYAVVKTIYVPPQKGGLNGVKLLKDPNEKLVDRAIEACGMQRVGWLITTLPRGDEKKYKGDILLSGDEIMTAARLQSKYCNANTGYSRFTTMVLHVGFKEPDAYMVSDQGVAMIRHSLISADEDCGFMKVNVPPANVYVPAVINEQSQVEAGKTLLPDALIVSVRATGGEEDKRTFDLIHFPYNGTLDTLRKHMLHHKDKPYHKALSDFYLLCFLAQVIDVDLACRVAKQVVSKKRFDEQLQAELKKAFQAIGVIA